MRRSTRFNRRQFLHTATAATVAIGSLSLPSQHRLRAASAVGETEHFWYRLAPEGPYIDSQRENKAFGFRDDKIFLSEDNGQSWAHSAVFPEAENITFSCLMKNGNVLFATREKLFLSTDNLKTHRQILVKDHKGGDYLPHTPPDPDQPGWYFHSLDGIHTWDIDGQEMLVWGNYCNVLGGPVPVNIYYRPTARKPSSSPFRSEGIPTFKKRVRRQNCSWVIPAARSFADTFTLSFIIQPSELSTLAPETSIAGTAMNATGCEASMTCRPTRGIGGCSSQ